MLNKNLDLSAHTCASLHGVGKRTAERLANLGIQSIQDLLFHLPARYQDRTRIFPIADLTPGDHVVIEGEIIAATHPIGGRTRLLCKLKDNSGHIFLRFFYVNAFQRQQLSNGVQIRCYGEVRFGPQGLEMIHPEYHVAHANLTIPVEQTLTPIYPTTEGLSQLAWRKLTEQSLAMLTQGGMLGDVLPHSILEKFNYPSLAEALHFVHRPPANAPVDLLLQGKHIAQKRLVFEELLAHRLSLLHLKKSFQVHRAFPLKSSSQLLNNFMKQLPFTLTNAQQHVVAQITEDLNCHFPMLRLVQGDVGSGKTVVAALAILQAVENNYQAAIMAPTELLAEQHYRTFAKWLEPLGIKIALLSGHVKTVQRRDILSGISSGEIKVIIGTHAIFQKGIEFANLALVVVDEQHRFGVQQRALLLEKGVQGDVYPHQLIMTATPIPRTLAMSVYADLDYSVIDELPPGRTPVSTVVISNTRRDEVVQRVRQACLDGRQVYWVCTLISESELLQCQAAEKTAEELKECFPELVVGLLHGRMKSVEKEAVMSAFKKGDIQLLVATTVIEVGVDVPNASLMVIENAERLGLAQLHQLRGRVGRGAVASHCILLYQSLSKLARERLAVMRETTDGFRIAQRDLELRGPGEVLGTRQTGEVSLRIADLIRDSELLPAVQESAGILERDFPEVVQPLIRRWVGYKEKFGKV